MELAIRYFLVAVTMSSILSVMFCTLPGQSMGNVITYMVYLLIKNGWSYVVSGMLIRAWYLHSAGNNDARQKWGELFLYANLSAILIFVACLMGFHVASNTFYIMVLATVAINIPVSYWLVNKAFN
ncbi:hypothetical protein [Mucilaginibacter sp. CSA2-8R]|uniref:hypothetical protein n=1 Tax=Mucilaginibacter sp. CSA2-8R TaxID=3141542 RepID=UPI00315CD092